MTSTMWAVWTFNSLSNDSLGKKRTFSRIDFSQKADASSLGHLQMPKVIFLFMLLNWKTWVWGSCRTIRFPRLSVYRSEQTLASFDFETKSSKIKIMDFIYIYIFIYRLFNGNFQIALSNLCSTVYCHHLLLFLILTLIFIVKPF